MFEWLLPKKKDVEPLPTPKRHVTIADLISKLLQSDRDAELGVTDMNITNILQCGWNRDGIKLITANKIDVFELYPTRLLVEGEPGYVPGLKNVTKDDAVNPLIWFNLVRQYDAPTMTVADFLQALYTMNPDYVLAHQSADPYSAPATNIALAEFHPVRDLLPGEPGYLEGLGNQTYTAHKYVSLFINGVDWSQDNY
jgi:hypothetical protein